MGLRDYLRVLGRDWPVFLLFAILGIGLASAFTVTQKPVYKATSSVFVAVQSQPSAADLVQGATFTQQMVLTYADLATKPVVLDPVIESLHLPVTSQQLAGQVDAEAPLDTVIIDITVSDNSPTNAARIANAVSSTLIATVPKVTVTTGRTVSPVRITPVAAAVVPMSPSSPVIPLNLLIGLAAGIVLALVIAVVRETLDGRVRDLREFELVTHRAVLGSIPIDPAIRRSPLITQAGASPDRTEAYRALRSTLQLLDVEPGAQAIVVTSTVRQEGRSTTAANLAIAAAGAGRRVALVDADLREPSIARTFGLDEAMGLTDALSGSARLEDLLCEVGPGLAVLPSGPPPVDPGGLMLSDAMADLLDQLVDRYDLVVLDTPPLLGASEAAVLARRVSGALLVAGSGQVARQDLRDAVRALDRVDAALIGVVLTMTPRRARRRSPRRAPFTQLERPATE